MSHFEALIYGLVQGATEYLPVSSSAHLLLLPHVLGQTDPGLAFDVILHLGTLLATAVYFFWDWVEVLKHPLPSKNPSADSTRSTLSWVHLIVGTLPAVIVGLILNQWIKDHTRSIAILYFTLPGFGLLLWWIDKTRPSARRASEATVKDLLFIGCMQALALIPGVSRSGSTITAARWLGFQRADSARLSFLLSMPVTLGAILMEARHWNELTQSMSGAMPMIIGCAAALISGALAIHLLIKWVSRTSFAVFAAYRVVVAVMVAVFLE